MSGPFALPSEGAIAIYFEIVQWDAIDLLEKEAIVNKRWLDAVTMLLGVWLFNSPSAVEYAELQTAALNAYVIGAIIVMFSAVALYAPRAWDEIVNLLLGVWLLLSSFVLRFASEHAAAVNAAIVGAVILAFAILALLSEAEFEQ